MEVPCNSNNNENYISSWKIIAEKVEQILNPDSQTTMIFEPLYSRIYKHVLNGYSKQMHIDLITLCSRHLNAINQELCPEDDRTLDHVFMVYSHLTNYLKSVKNVASVFSYLNKMYVAFYLNVDLYIQLGGLFCQIIISRRLPVLMEIIQQSYNVPFSIPPDVLHSFFNDLHQISQGEYSAIYPQLFSKYCLNVLPSMKESDLEDHISEVSEFQRCLRNSEYASQENHGVKRSADDETNGRRINNQFRQTKTYPTTFH